MNLKKICFYLCFSFFCFFVFAANEASLMKQGIDFYKAKKYKQAYNTFEKVVEKNPNNYQAYLYMGYCAIAMNDTKRRQ